MARASQVPLCCAALAALAAGPAEAQRLRRGLLPPARPRPLVLALRRPGLRSYEKVIEEFRGRVSAEIRVLAARPRAGEPAVAELTRWVAQVRPNLVFAVGQSAHDFARAASLPLPLLHVLVYHQPAAKPARGIAAQPPPPRVIRALALARPPGAGAGRLLALHGRRTAAVVAAARAVAEARGLRLEGLAASSPSEALRLLRRAVAGRRPGEAAPLVGLWLVADPQVLTPQVSQYAIALQFRRRVALMGATRQHVSQGALFAVDFDPALLGRRAAEAANALLRRRERRAPRTPRRGGAPTLETLLGPAPTRLTVNQTTARRLGVLLERLAPLAPEVLR